MADSPQEADLILYVNAPVQTQGNGDSQWLIRRGTGPVRAQLPQEFHPWLERFTGSEGFRATRREMESPGRNPEEFVRGLLRRSSGRPVAMADVAVCQRRRPRPWATSFAGMPQVAALRPSAGWNTAGIRSGAVLAQAVIRVLALRAGPTRDQQAAHLEFLFPGFSTTTCTRAANGPAA